MSPRSTGVCTISFLWQRLGAVLGGVKGARGVLSWHPADTHISPTLTGHGRSATYVHSVSKEPVMIRRTALFACVPVLLARGLRPCAGIVPDHGEACSESLRDIPDLVLSAVGAAQKPASDRVTGADGAACHPTPAERSADADRVSQPRGGTHCQQTIRVQDDSLMPACGIRQHRRLRPYRERLQRGRGYMVLTGVRGCNRRSLSMARHMRRTAQPRRRCWGRILPRS
jgi:hypothetical protein